MRAFGLVESFDYRASRLIVSSNGHETLVDNETLVDQRSPYLTFFEDVRFFNETEHIPYRSVVDRG
jgi:hypothetical protein